MFDWHISLNNGRIIFEGNDLDKVIDNMIKHYVENELSPNQITLITAYDDEGELVCEYTNENQPLRLGELQDRFEQGVKDWNKEILNNRREEEMTRRDLRMVLV